MRKKLLVIIFLLGLSIALLGNPSPSEAGTIIVDGTCTLVDAIIAANTDAPSGQCPAGNGDDEIQASNVNLIQAYPGSTMIGGAQAAVPDITSNIRLLIEVSNSGISTVDQNFRFANVMSGKLELLAFVEDFTINKTSGSLQGGLIYVADLATLEISYFDGFSLVADSQNDEILGGLIYNEGAISVNRTFIRESQFLARNGQVLGGVFHNAGTMTMRNSQFYDIYTYGNTTQPVSGGTVYSSGSLTVENSTFELTGAGNEGGDAYGGALAVEGPTSVSNSTFIINFAGTLYPTEQDGFGGAIAINTSESVSISHSTFLDQYIIGNEGEIIFVVSGLPTINGSILASDGNCDGCGELFAQVIDAPDCSGAMTGSANLTEVGDNSCSSISSGTIQKDVHISTALTDNGGQTDTFALINLPGNPAVDGNPSCGLLTDQRNYDRDINCDIGAFELNGVPPTATPTPTFTPTDTPTETPTPIGLSVNAVCVDENLEVTITDGDGPFEISASGGGNLPVTVGIGTHTIPGPDKWDDLTVTEQSGDGQSSNLGTFKCRTDERPVPLSPAHGSLTTNPFPTFSWTGISDANNYRLWLFDDAVAANRTVDIRQNSGGPTTLMLSTPLPVDRLFWRVRGRQNRVWSLWSIRFTLFVDPPTAQESVVTPVPTIELGAPTSTPVPTIGVPDAGLTPVPTLIQPPNSR